MRSEKVETYIICDHCQGNDVPTRPTSAWLIDGRYPLDLHLTCAKSIQDTFDTLSRAGIHHEMTVDKNER